MHAYVRSYMRTYTCSTSMPFYHQAYMSLLSPAIIIPSGLCAHYAIRHNCHSCHHAPVSAYVHTFHAIVPLGREPSLSKRPAPIITQPQEVTICTVACGMGRTESHIQHDAQARDMLWCTWASLVGLSWWIDAAPETYSLSYLVISDLSILD